jgi:glycosyltransferase involved in cell wall biosynthesis
MRILIISTTDILGGAAKVAWEIKNACEARGDIVTMFVADKRSTEPNVHIIPRPYWRKVLGFILATEDLLASDWILKTKAYQEADIVHCHNIHGRYFNLRTLEKMASEKPVIWTLHDEWAITPHCAYTLEGSTLKNGLYVCPSINTPPRLLWDNSSALSRSRSDLYARIKLQVVTPSLWLKSRVEKTNLARQTLHHISNGIDTTTFVQTDQKSARMKLGLPLDKKIILFLATAGKANTWKGWIYTEAVIKHFSTRTDILFLNVGNLQTEQTEPHVEYRGHVGDPNELALYYSAADVLLFTSIAENFPLVILEAMSCGLPIVAFDVGGVKEVLTHEQNGYVGRYLNVPDLITGLNWVFGLSPQQKMTLHGASSAKIASQYDTKHMTAAYQALYENLIHDNRN